MRILAVVMVILGSGASTLARAQTMDCDNALTQMQMNACAVADFNQADVDLNAAYARARSAMQLLDQKMDGDAEEAELALRNAQRAWITFRDRACLAEGFLMRGGSAEPLLVFGCKARLTEQRAQDLWTLAAGIEG